MEEEEFTFQKLRQHVDCPLLNDQRQGWGKAEQELVTQDVLCTEDSISHEAGRRAMSREPEFLSKWSGPYSFVNGEPRRFLSSERHELCFRKTNLAGMSGR